MPNELENYISYYQDPAVDVFTENYTTVLDYFTEDQVHTTSQILNKVLASMAIPHVFAVLAANKRNQPRVYILRYQHK